MRGAEAGRLNSHGLAASHCVRQGAAVDVLQFAADRNAVSYAADIDAALPHQLRQKIGCGLAFDGGIGR